MKPFSSLSFNRSPLCLCAVFWALAANGLQLETLTSFTSPAPPYSSLVQGPDGSFYGVSGRGGDDGGGAAFSISTNGLLTTFRASTGNSGADLPAGLIWGPDGNLYGTSISGGTNDGGAILRIAPDGTMTTLVSFALGDTNGSQPRAGLALGSDGCLYGTTSRDGGDNHGTVFKMSTDGVLTVLTSFTGTNGANPRGALVPGGDGQFYGTTEEGGAYDAGTVFKVTTNGTLTTLVSFDGTNDGYPATGLVLGKDGHFYGTTSVTAYRITPTGNFASLASFKGTNDSSPSGLIQGADGILYGTTAAGGAYGSGSVFALSTNGLLTTLLSFNRTNGASPSAGLLQATNGNLYGTTDAGGANGWGTAFQITTNGNLTTLLSFTSDNGTGPEGPLIQGADGSLYGTTYSGGGGSPPVGTVFRLTTAGALTSLASFNHTNGAFPGAGLVEGARGHFFGTTSSDKGLGTIFEITSQGVLTTLVRFAGTNGAEPDLGPGGTLVRGSDGNLYGTTAYGGPEFGSTFDKGTVFRMTTNGILTTLVAFNGANGASPSSGLVLGSDGNFYGTTSRGGTENLGTVFRVTMDGTLTTLASFTGTNGASPSAGLVQASDGDFYGTTFGGGASGVGTVFRITSDGRLSSIASFTPATGIWPQSGLVEGPDGNFYGTTSTFGPSGDDQGTIFTVSPTGGLTVLLSFKGANGAHPSDLALGSDGSFYGTTEEGGAKNYGTVYRLRLFPRFTSVIRTSSSGMLLNGTGPANDPFSLWSSSDVGLPLSFWTLLTTSNFDSTGHLTVSDEGSTTDSVRFYRITSP